MYSYLKVSSSWCKHGFFWQWLRPGIHLTVNTSTCKYRGTNRSTTSADVTWWRWLAAGARSPSCPVWRSSLPAPDPGTCWAGWESAGWPWPGTVPPQCPPRTDHSSRSRWLRLAAAPHRLDSAQTLGIPAIDFLVNKVSYYVSSAIQLLNISFWQGYKSR